jgi:outer membrane protein insertion porin family
MYSSMRRHNRWPRAHEPGQERPTIVERIEFEGNRRIRSETLQGAHLYARGRCTAKRVCNRDFQALWNTQYFEDVRLEVQDSPDRANGKIVIFHVVERPVIRRIEYHGLKSVSESDILDAIRT